MNRAWSHTPAGKPRARTLPLAFEGTPGAANAITDVPGVEVGYTTLISGEGPLKVGEGPVRTGVTAIIPRGKANCSTACWAATYALNGNGEMTGAHWLEETGLCELAITITNTHSCGLTRDATLQWSVARKVAGAGQDWGLPISAETYDGSLNDINGFHVKAEHVFQALDSAHGGPLEEGSVGGGTGMICYGFKGGNGTASRVVEIGGETFTLGTFVQANFGASHELLMGGLPMGQLLKESIPSDGAGSIIIVIATDAPLLPHQLKRLARRAAIGLGRTGSIGRHSSGDIFLAFSTANAEAIKAKDKAATARFLPEATLNPLFEAVIRTTEEAIYNALVANETMTGIDGYTVPAFPRERAAALLAKERCVGVTKPAGQGGAKAS